jgi:hypothetical protein
MVTPDIRFCMGAAIVGGRRAVTKAIVEVVKSMVVK